MPNGERIATLLLTYLKTLGAGPGRLHVEDLGRCIAIAERIREAVDKCNFNKTEITEEFKEVYNFLDTIENEHRVIHLEDSICDDLLCKIHLGSNFIYRDKGHLSQQGSVALGKELNFTN